MKILMISCIYNELELLPQKHEWAVENNIDEFYLDNYSNDGTTQWLLDNNIDFDMLYTNGEYSLNKNVVSMHHKFHEIKPDWCIISAPDMFLYHLDYETIFDFIVDIDNQGYTCIDTSLIYNFYYTGDEVQGCDLRKGYFYYKKEKQFSSTLIAKYCNGLSIEADTMYPQPNKKYVNDRFITLHYYLRNDARKIKTEQYKRRVKSWNNNTSHKDHGNHLSKLVEEDKWIWNVLDDNLMDIRMHEIWKNKLKGLT